MTANMGATPRHNGATLVRTVDGELAGMDSGPAPLGPTLEELVNRSELSTNTVLGHLSWSGNASLASGGTSTVFALVIGAINAVMIYDGTGYSSKASAGETLTLAHVQGAPAALASNTRYYAYAKLSGVNGALAFEVSSTPPSANGVFKNGDPTQVYLRGATFVTDGSGNPLPFRCVHGRYRYSITGMPASINDLRVLNGTASATAWADIDLSSLVPPYARNIHLRAQVINGVNNKTGRAQFRTKGHTSGSVDLDVAEMGASGTANYNQLHFDLECDANRAIQYQRADGGGTYADLDVFVWVLGWDE